MTPTERICPTCGGSVPSGFGRPKVYCSSDCRRAMARRVQFLADVEASLTEAEAHIAEWGRTPTYAPGRANGIDRWRREAVALLRERDTARALVPEGLRP